MKDKPDASLDPSPEQVRYAAVLEKGMYLGLGTLFVTFALYVFGIMEPHIPLETLSEHWTKSVHDYLADAEIEAGWGWVKMLSHGDFINFVGITILAGATAVCYLAVIPLLVAKKDFVYVVLAAAEVVVLLFAASGIIAVGH